MAYPFIFLLLFIVVVIVATPLWRARGHAESHAAEQARRADLEAARDAKLAEIRDAELDHRIGKLSDADHRALERQLRAEAIEILSSIDALEDEETE
jgi:hypothetical protein